MEGSGEPATRHRVAGSSTSSVPDRAWWYRFGDAILALRSSSQSFRQRFFLLFGGCAVDDPGTGLPKLSGVVDVDATTNQVRIAVEGAEIAEPEALVQAVFSDDGVESVSRRGEWLELASRLHPAWRMDLRRDQIVTSANAPWQYVAGAFLVHRAMAVQQGVIFVHAAGVELDGEAVLLVGPRGAGKTTLAVGLAARGYRFLGDEVGAIRFGGPSVLSFPRAAGVRPGPRATASASVLDHPGLLVERFADGTSKTLVPASWLQAVPPGEALRLGRVIVLDGRAATPRLTDLAATPGNVRYLAPVKSMPFSTGSGSKTLGLLRTASTVRWHRLTAGAPDETITLIEERCTAT
jgi:hypothetical protein